MSDRGMKKFAPYASLIEQNDYLNNMKYEKGKRDKPHISNEIAEEINEILTNYNGETLEFHYFYDGYVYKLKSKILRIDIYGRKLKLEQGDLPFASLVNIKRTDKDQ